MQKLTSGEADDKENRWQRYKDHHRKTDDGERRQRMRRSSKGTKFSDIKQLVSNRSLSVLTQGDSLTSTTTAAQ